MPRGELICEGCGQYESECSCPELGSKKYMTDKLREKKGEKKVAMTYLDLVRQLKGRIE